MTDPTKPILPWQARVIGEAKDLHEKLDALTVFVGSPAFKGVDPEEQALLMEQAAHMRRYLTVLKARVARWVPA